LSAPSAAVGLDADIVHVHPPVHAAHHIGLGDDQGRGSKKEAPDLRGHGDESSLPRRSTSTEGIAQDAKSAALAGDQITTFGVTVEFELAHSQGR
jgi:hypothetical protein